MAEADRELFQFGLMFRIIGSDRGTDANISSVPVLVRQRNHLIVLKLSTRVSMVITNTFTKLNRHDHEAIFNQGYQKAQQQNWNQSNEFVFEFNRELDALGINGSQGAELVSIARQMVILYLTIHCTCLLR